MKKENVQIDIDQRIIEYINNSIDIEKMINNIIYTALEYEALNADKIYISIQTVSLDEIRQLNKQYRNIDQETDVLSFPIFDKNEIQDLINESNDSKKLKEIELGDIIICLDVVQKQSIEYKTGIKRELLYMITHGICHLLGFDHIDEEDKKVMRSMEERILDKLGVGKING